MCVCVCYPYIQTLLINNVSYIYNINREGFRVHYRSNSASHRAVVWASFKIEFRHLGGFDVGKSTCSTTDMSANILWTNKLDNARWNRWTQTPCPSLVGQSAGFCFGTCGGLRKAPDRTYVHRTYCRMPWYKLSPSSSNRIYNSNLSNWRGQVRS